MKFTLAALALLASTVVAAPTADADADAWCDRPGQPCWKAKRDAEADAWCDRPGQPCWKAKRDAEAEAWCDRPGQPCWKVKRAADAFSDTLAGFGELQARSPEADNSEAAHYARRSTNDLAHFVSLSKKEPEAFFNSLELEARFGPDTKSVQKREVATEGKRWCETLPVGNDCWKRDTEPADKRWCDRPGQPCWKAKRAAEAVMEVIEAPVAKREAKPEAEAEADADADADAWCDRPGQPCWKAKRDADAWCDRPGQPCWKAKRDLTTIGVAARQVLDTVA